MLSFPSVGFTPKSGKPMLEILRGIRTPGSQAYNLHFDSTKLMSPLRHFLVQLGWSKGDYDEVMILNIIQGHPGAIYRSVYLQVLITNLEVSSIRDITDPSKIPAAPASQPLSQRDPAHSGGNSPLSPLTAHLTSQPPSLPSSTNAFAAPRYQVHDL